MRILIDTNIFIPLESAAVFDELVSELSRLAHEHGHTVLIHPSTVSDFERDRDTQRRKERLNKLRKYPVLEDPPKLTEPVRLELGLGQSTDNDRVDNDLLYAVKRNAVGLLISEDLGVHKKAQRLGIAERVHYVQQAVEFLRRLHARARIALPNVEDIALHNLDEREPLFESLVSDYAEFRTWFERIAQEGRRAWITRTDRNRLGAICIYKEEKDPVVTSSGRRIPGTVLKLCTFKVGEDSRGQKIGELFLKAAFRYASENNIESIYVTIRPGKQPHLEELCEDFGFLNIGSDGRDNVFLKQHPIAPPVLGPEDPMDYHRAFFPRFRAGPAVRKFVIPIRPMFHDILFPDYRETSDQLSLLKGIPSSAGNAIKQAYLCNSRIKSIRKGDVALFYRSRDDRLITSVGIVELSGDFRDADEIAQIVSKRTVYGYDDIRELAKKPTKVILFRLATHLPTPISSEWLQSKGLVSGQIQTIRQIEHEIFEAIAINGGLRPYCLLAD